MKALVLGCAGPTLTDEERALFRSADPWGFILFRRNVVSPDQVRALTAALRESVGRPEAPVFVDQEGGRVQRLGAPHWPSYPPGAVYGLMENGFARLGARLIAADLRAVGITANCAPVLDVPVAGANDVIGDRAYATEPQRVAALGRAAMAGYLAGGVLPVVKHIPGHGRGNADSHRALPVVEASEAELAAHDFVPFRALADAPLAMTAHVVYAAVDPDRPATVSPIVIERIVRGHIGFGGLLLTDDLSMNALSGTIGERAAAALAAGCDIALHCNGVLPEMRELAAAAPDLAGEAAVRAARALGLLEHPPEAFDPVDERLRFEAAVAAALANRPASTNPLVSAVAPAQGDPTEGRARSDA